MAGALATYDNLISFSIVQTFLLSFSFYFIISGILSNMYWVFVKNELVNFEIQKEAREKKNQHLISKTLD